MNMPQTSFDVQCASNALGLEFHHLGLAVRKPDAALRYIHALGYASTEPIYDPEQNVRLIMCTHSDQPDIEIIFPGDGPGPLDGMLTKHAKGIIYHPCYISQNTPATLAAIERAGLEILCVAESKPAILFGGTSVSFYQIVGIGLIEIIEGRPLRN